jgi:hypothetical protein
MDINNQIYIINVKPKTTKTTLKEHKKYKKENKNGQHSHTLALKSEPLTYFNIQISRTPTKLPTQ